MENIIQGTALLRPARAPRGHLAPPSHRTSGQIFSLLSVSVGFLGRGYKDNTCYTPEQMPQSTETPCRERRVLRGCSKARDSCGAEACPASGASEEPPTGAGLCPRPARCPHPSTLRYATQQARLGNGIIVPNVCSLCWGFTGMTNEHNTSR